MYKPKIKLRFKKQILLFFFILNALFSFSQNQITNYVYNGSLEEHYTCVATNSIVGYLVNAIGWDEIYSSATRYCHKTCLGNVPYNGIDFQYPKSGYAYVMADFFILNDISTSPRTYLRNHLKSNLIYGKSYCVKFYVNIVNGSSCGINRFQAYFGDSSLDTIKYAHMRLIYLNPQIKSPINYLVTDTLSWVPITGTFTANGSEKYMLIGNFETDAATTYTMLYSTTGFTASTVNIDDVSCIPLELPASAGQDKSCIAGDSVFIGRAPDVEIDESCQWFKLPNMSAPIATVAGLYVKPVTTTTYVVRQQLWCSGVKWDTVVVYQDFVGINKLRIQNEELKIYPIPANDILELEWKSTSLVTEPVEVTITNVFGDCLQKEEIIFENNKAKIKTDFLVQGFYFLELKIGGQSFTKKFCVGR